MRFKLAVLPILLTLAVVAAPARAAVTLHVTAAQHYDAGATASKVPADSSSDMEVTLGDSYIQVDSKAGRLVYDFKTRRRYAIDTAARVYVEYSLYDTVGFRTMEMKNRERLHGVLAGANVAPGPLVAASLENELSLFKDGPGALDQKTAGDGPEFAIAGVRLASWSREGAKVSAADAARFAQFVRYAQGGHPQVLEKLAAGGAIPQRLTLYMNGGLGPGRTATLNISAVRPVQAPAYDLSPYQREAGASGIDSLLDRIAAMTPQQLDALSAEHPCDNSDDFSADRVLDTVLGRLECTLSTGAPLSLTAEQKEAAGASASLGLLFAAINPGKQDEYANAIKTLEGLRARAPRKGYVLKIFEANNRARSGQVKEATQLFTEALQANPVLAGAYKDLGDALLMQFDTPRAWRCWDVGRRIAPGLANFEAVNKFERDLAAQHPRYF